MKPRLVGMAVGLTTFLCSATASGMVGIGGGAVGSADADADADAVDSDEGLGAGVGRTVPCDEHRDTTLAYRH